MLKPSILILSLLVACVPPVSPANESEDGNENTRLQEFVFDPFDDPIGHSMVLMNAKTKIIERFGPPINVDSWELPDRTSDAVFPINSLEYDGIVFVVGENEGQTGSWIQSIAITGDSHLLKFGLAIGSKRDDIIAALDPEYFLNTENQLRMTADIWEERTDTEYRPGEVVRLDSHIELNLDIDENDSVTKFFIEAIEL